MHIDSDVRIALLMHDVSRMLRYRFDARARRVGVTRPQWRALLNLARSPGITQAELADALEVERITLCRMIDRLAEAALVERRADPNDRRVWRLHLLPSAHAIVEELAGLAAELEEEMLAPLDAEARSGLKASLLGIREWLRGAGGEPRKEVA